MINQKYKNAYKEILEILKFMPKDELSKIPEEKKMLIIILFLIHLFH